MVNHMHSDGAMARRSSPAHKHKWKGLAVALTASVLLVMSALPAWAADVMTVTFIRHGESEGNTSGLIDTSTPGPSLTATGEQQAQAIANKLSYNNYDGIFASTMVRTQQTAAPMSDALGLPVTVLPGLQEIEAGDYEGTPEADAVNGYLKAPIQWVQGNRDAQIAGSITGTQFEDRFNDALQTIYDTGDRNPVVFSHGGAIMFWVMMNVTNLTLQQKFALFASAPLTNTNYVVVQGNPTDGWTLVNWNGQQFTAEPTLTNTVALQTRTLVRQLAAAVQKVQDAFATGNVVKVLSAISSGVSTAAFSVQKYVRAVGTAVAQKVGEAVTEIKTNITNALQGNKTAGTATTDGSTGSATNGDGTSGTQAGAAAAAAVAASNNAGSATATAKRLKATAQKPATVAGVDAKAADASVVEASDAKVSDANADPTVANTKVSDTKVSATKADDTVTRVDAKVTKQQKVKATKEAKAGDTAGGSTKDAKTAAGSHVAKHAAKHDGAKKAKAAAAH